MGDTTDDANPLRKLIGFVDEDEFEDVRSEANKFRVEMRGHENEEPAPQPSEIKERLLGGDDGSA